MSAKITGRACGGRVTKAFVIGQLLAHLDYLEEAITTLSAEIERVMAPLAEP